MIDKMFSKIKRYPFQTGIVIGLVLCLLLIGFINLFRDNGKTLSANNALIREDYLRMSINEYSQNRDDQLAQWRYDHLGSAADATLKLMRGDTSVSARDLVSFAEAVGKGGLISDNYSSRTSAETPAGTPANPRKGLSGFGKTLLIILGVIVVCAAGLFAASLIKTKNKQKRRAEANQRASEEPLNMVPAMKTEEDTSSSDTLFDLDKLFPQKDAEGESSSEDDSSFHDLKLFDESSFETEDSVEKVPETESHEGTETLDPTEDVQEDADQKDDDITESTDDTDSNTAEDAREAGMEALQDEPEPVSFPEHEEPAEAEEDGKIQDKNEPSGGLDLGTGVYDINGNDSVDQEDENAVNEPETEEPEELPEPVSFPDTEKPLIETESVTNPNSEDELLKMIRELKKDSDEILGKSVTAGETAEGETEQKSIENVIPEEEPEEEDPEGDEAPVDDVLIHYQSTYRIGNDMYDEVFSIDHGDVFRGECGISIGETLNNTEPKAVTAFEVWLFDKDDIHTATWYLMSDFAMSNEGISERLAQRGTCERIRKNKVYTLETETLSVDIKVLDLEYGTEMEEKNSYFTNATFDVVVHQKGTAAE